MRKLFAITFVVAAVTSAHADFKDILAQRLTADAADLVVNLPPRPGAYPGAIFTANLRIPISYGVSTDPALHRGDPVALSAAEGYSVGGTAAGGLAGFFHTSASASEIEAITVTFPDAHVVDMSEDDLIKHIEASQSAMDAATGGQNPLIIIRSYEGTPKITITRGAQASAAEWAKITADASANGKVDLSSDRLVTYSAAVPIVFAFETDQAVFDPKELAQRKAKVHLAALPSSLFAAREGPIEEYESPAQLAFQPSEQETLGYAVGDPARQTASKTVYTRKKPRR